MKFKEVKIFSIMLLLIISGCQEQPQNNNANGNKINPGSTFINKINAKSNNTLNKIIVKKEDIRTLQDSADFLTYNFKRYQEGDSKSEIAFFDLFPDTFIKFSNLYGFTEKETYAESGPNPLYKQSVHIDNYYPKAISNKEYIHKLINISVNGTWDSDNISFLQERVKKKLFNNNEIFISILKEKTNNQTETVWRFMFDGPHPDNPEVVEDYHKILNIVGKNDPSMVPLVKKAYAYVVNDWADA